MKQGQVFLLWLALGALALMAGCLTLPGQRQAALARGSETAGLSPTTSDTPTATATAVPPSPTPTARPIPTATPTPTLTPTPTPALPAIQRILLLGTDERPGSSDKTWRTDAIMVVTVDAENKRIGMLGIPRDLIVTPPTLGEMRINQVDYLGELYEYPGGGPALLADTLKETFGLEIDHYVRFKQQGFVQAIDAIGGITVTLECPLQEFAPADPGSDALYKELYLEAGTHHLDGETALKFVTYRYRFGDWERAKRQQLLLLALREQALQLNMLPKIPALWDIVKDSVQSDLSLLDWVRLAYLATQIDPQDIHGRVIDETMTEDYITEAGGMALSGEMEEIKEVIETLFDVPPASEFYSKSGHCPPIWPSPTPTATPTPEA
ncbi:MAG: LCP family protein [Anaerolineae bacterium]|nr:LCP family protein [Anaerolineae bacterium]